MLCSVLDAGIGTLHSELAGLNEDHVSRFGVCLVAYYVGNRYLARWTSRAYRSPTIPTSFTSLVHFLISRSM